MSEEVKLPYFDVVLEDKKRENKLLDNTLDMHWGYWENPALAYTEEAQRFLHASKALSRLIYDQVGIKEGCKFADIGCGFGGTIDLINQNFENIDMVGLNIDPRQIEAARSRVRPVNGNKIEFITGDACDLPFEDESIDSLTAVECIFHFHDKEKFFSEVSRVLKPGGKFAFSDFVPAKERKKIVTAVLSPFQALIGKHYGSTSTLFTLDQYNETAIRNNLKNICALDINSNVLPTFKSIYFIIDYSGKGIKFFKKIPTRLLEFAQKQKIVLYMVIAYQKQ